MSDTIPVTVDAKGRVLIHNLSDRELLEEIAYNLRAFTDALESLGKNPMLKAMIPGLSI